MQRVSGLTREQEGKSPLAWFSAVKIENQEWIYAAFIIGDAFLVHNFGREIPCLNDNKVSVVKWTILSLCSNYPLDDTMKVKLSYGSSNFHFMKMEQKEANVVIDAIRSETEDLGFQPINRNWNRGFMNIIGSTVQVRSYKDNPSAHEIIIAGSVLMNGRRKKRK